MYEGFSYKFVPIKNKMKSTDIGFADPEDLYYKIKNVYSWDALKRKDYFVDYQNLYTFCGVLSQRNVFVNAAKEMLKIGDRERAVELLDMCQECVQEENFPLDMTYLGFSNEYMVIDMIETYYLAGLLTRYSHRSSSSFRITIWQRGSLMLAITAYHI